MPDIRPETVVVADHGTEEDLGQRGDHAAPLSDGLISALGRLAVREALTAETPEQAAPPTNQVNAPGFTGDSMGKPLQLIKGHFYFIARCPVTGDILDAIPDQAAGTGGPLTGEWRVACADCNTTHALDLSNIGPEKFTLPASPIPEP